MSNKINNFDKINDSFSVGRCLHLIKYILGYSLKPYRCS